MVGLALALLGPGLLAWAGASTCGLSPLACGLLGQLLLWLLLALVLTFAFRTQGLSPAQIGLRSLHWASLPFGLALWALQSYVISPPLLSAMSRFGTGFQPGIDSLSALPTAYLFLAVVTAGIVEETLYRGYAFHRLETLFGNRWAAALVVLLVFGAVHIPFWGLGASIGMTLGGAIPMMIFVLRRDLYAFMLAHALTDATGLIIVPRLLGKTLI